MHAPRLNTVPAPAAKPGTEPRPLILALRALAALVILWHHFASYPPLSAWAAPLLGPALEWLADASAEGNLNRDQQLMLQQYLAVMPQAYPGFPIEDYRRGAARDHWDTLSACRGPAGRQSSASMKPSGPRACRW